MRKPQEHKPLDDLSHSLTPFEPNQTLIAVIESWLVAEIISGMKRQPLKKLALAFQDRSLDTRGVATAAMLLWGLLARGRSDYGRSTAGVPSAESSDSRLTSPPDARYVKNYRRTLSDNFHHTLATAPS